MRMKEYIISAIMMTATCSICAQDANRLYSGIGTGKDTNYTITGDISLFLLKEESRFNIGTHIGMHYARFNNPSLATNGALFIQSGFQAQYRASKKVVARLDLSSRHPINKKNFSFIDAMGEPIPDSQLGGHVLLIPSIAYDITDITSAFIFYGAAFENRLNLNTLGLGISVKL